MSQVPSRSFLAKVEGRVAMTPQLNPSRERLATFIQRAADSLPAGSKVLDAGAGDGRYRVHFTQHDYESADFAQVDKAYANDLTYTCDLSAVPVEDDRYDLVLLTQVMEHLPDPASVLREMKRVLKPGGTVWMSAPLYYPEHEQPYDFYRYTQFGHRHLLKEAGFEVQEIDWMEGYFGTLAYQLQAGAFNLPSRVSAYGKGPLALVGWSIAQISRPLMMSLSVVLALFERRNKYTGSGMCKNYTVIARAI